MSKSIKKIITDGTAELGHTLTDKSIEAINGLNRLAPSDNIDDIETFRGFCKSLLNTIEKAKMTNEIDQEASSLPDPDDPPVEPKKTSPDSPADSPAASNETQPTPDSKPAAEPPKHAAPPTDDEPTSTDNADASDSTSQEAHNDTIFGKLKAAGRKLVQPREDQIAPRKR